MTTDTRIDFNDEDSNRSVKAAFRQGAGHTPEPPQAAGSRCHPGHAKALPGRPEGVRNHRDLYETLDGRALCIPSSTRAKPPRLTATVSVP